MALRVGRAVHLRRGHAQGFPHRRHDDAHAAAHRAEQTTEEEDGLAVPQPHDPASSLRGGEELRGHERRTQRHEGVVADGHGF